MTDIEILAYGFLIVATASSFYLGRKQGIRDTVNFLETEGMLEFEDEEK
jgi:hypothetical protein